MFRPRIIPVLLLRKNSLVKSRLFKDHKYIGDPINAVKTFNDFKADELIILDILAYKEGRHITTEFVKQLGEETNMPFAVGGGIKSLSDIQSLLKAGAERVIINSYAVENPDFIKQAADTFGSSSITVCIDIKKNTFHKYKTYTHGGRTSTSYTPVDFAKLMEDKAAGELIIQSIDRDGTMNGYDIEILKKISDSVSIPVVALGGAGSLHDMKKVYEEGGGNSMAAGSMFVYYGIYKGVLINYPSKREITINF